MGRRQMRWGLLFWTFIAAPCSATNIVLIMADDMGYECVGANGCTSYKTPNLDRLASAGMQFRHCYSQPLCTPSRVQIMTGKYNFRNYEKFEFLNPAEKTFGHLFRDAGYDTLIAGKWQLNGTYSQKPNHDDTTRPQQFGFQQSYLWHVTDRPQRYKNPVLEKNGAKQSPQEGKYGPDLVTDFICEFLEQEHDKPFFVYYPMILPHGPFVPTPDGEDWESGPKKGKVQTYYAEMVSYVDKLVGRIANKLQEQNLDDETLLLFTTDNGSPGGIVTSTDRGTVAGAKGKPITRGTHVPLIAWQPGTVPPGTIDDLVDFTDFLPTIAEAANVDIPVNFVVDGRSFLPQLQGQPGTPRDSIACWYDPRHSVNTNKRRTLFVRNQRFKMYHDGRLFDLSTDDAEENDLRTSSNPDAVAARTLLQRQLEQLPEWK